MGLGEARKTVIVMVVELGRALVQGLALGDDLAVAHLLLRRHMPVDAALDVDQVGVEPRRQRCALTVVLGLRQGRLAQLRQLLLERRHALDGVLAGRAVEGVGVGVQSCLGGGQKAVLQAFDAVGIDLGTLGWWDVLPLGRKIELGHGYATHSTNRGYARDSCYWRAI